VAASRLVKQSRRLDPVSDWWQTFFDEGWAGVHASFLDETRTTEDVATVVALLALEPGARILDVPCGDGRISVPLAERGYRVSGIDLTERFLEQARERARAGGVEPDLRHGDMRHLPWRAEMDAAVCLWGSFGYFSDDENERFLRSVREALVPGGRFLLQSQVVETILPRFRDRWWEDVADTTLVTAVRYDVESGRVETEWRFVGDRASSVSRSSIRLYTAREVKSSLLDAGFSDVELLSRPGEPFELGSERFVALARAES
jgi:SAM-dependent methyltransferase